MKFESEAVREQARGDSLVLSCISDVTARIPEKGAESDIDRG